MQDLMDESFTILSFPFSLSWEPCRPMIFLLKNQSVLIKRRSLPCPLGSLPNWNIAYSNANLRARLLPSFHPNPKMCRVLGGMARMAWHDKADGCFTAWEKGSEGWRTMSAGALGNARTPLALGDGLGPTETDSDPDTRSAFAVDLLYPELSDLVYAGNLKLNWFFLSVGALSRVTWVTRLRRIEQWEFF